MTASRWRLIEEIFLVAAEKKREDRSRYIDDVCAGNEELKREVESLLAHENTGAPALKSAVRDADHKLTLPRDKYVGSRIGPYRIVRQLGHGGMALVYLAVRSDEHYFQTVAIKLVRSSELINRFRAERQILANLTHPNIAAILDGGSTEDGTPYLVMEFIEGESIVDYARSHALSTRKRIALFRSVCLAVHYAHQKLVIHRDIKPGNIMVTPDGTPKLLDFGIAKLLVPELLPSDATLTLAESRVMTPAYASPEQVRGDYITTATDVYSLGVVLFELLVGRPPYSTKSWSWRELERVVGHEPVPKPSQLTDVPPKIARELRGDLENIILMSMRKEPLRRYQSAEQLAEDLSRYLERQPVIAREDKAFYRAGKFIQRHKTLVGAVAALLAALICGTVTTAWQAHKAQHRVKELQTLVDSVIVTTNYDIANLPQSTELRAAMLTSTLNNLDKLTKDPDIAPQLLIQIAHAYARVGEIQGGPSTANLGRPDAALSSLEKALHVARQVAQQNGSDPEAMRLLIQAHYELGQMENYVGKADEAEQHITIALRLARPYQAAAPSDEGRRQFLAAALTGVADLQIASQQVREALTNYREALAVLDGAEFRGRSPKTLQIVGTIHNSIGLALTETGPLSDALEALRHAAEIREWLIREYPANLTYQRNLLITDLRIARVLGGTEFASMGDAVSASMYIAKARSIAERLAQLDSNNAQAKSDLAYAYATSAEVESYSHFGAAMDWFRKSIAIAQELLRGAPGSANYRWQLAIRSQQLADVLARSGRRREALAYAQGATKGLVDLVRLQPARKDFRRQLMTTHCLLCDLQHDLRDRAGALASQRAAMDMLASVSPGQPDLYFDYSLARCYDVFSLTDDKNSQEWRQKSRELWSRLEKEGVRQRINDEF
jgi:tetratricopeptide (TPR) repeat protein